MLSIKIREVSLLKFSNKILIKFLIKFGIEGTRCQVLTFDIRTMEKVSGKGGKGVRS